MGKFARIFRRVPDPRAGNARHELLDVLFIALAAVLCCGALIDGVQEFPGPWALVPVGATVLFILSAANRNADHRRRIGLPSRKRAGRDSIREQSIARHSRGTCRGPGDGTRRFGCTA